MIQQDKTKDLAKVSSNAEIVSVRLVNSLSAIDEKIDPHKLAAIFTSLVFQVRFGLVVGSQLKCYAKFILKAKDKANSKKHFMSIEATFELQYKLEKSLSFNSSEIESFCSQNAVFNAWPYWRELAQSQSTRMGLTPLVMPLFKVRLKK